MRLKKAALTLAVTVSLSAGTAALGAAPALADDRPLPDTSAVDSLPYEAPAPAPAQAPAPDDDPATAADTLTETINAILKDSLGGVDVVPDLIKDLLDSLGLEELGVETPKVPKVEKPQLPVEEPILPDLTEDLGVPDASELTGLAGLPELADLPGS